MTRKQVSCPLYHNCYNLLFDDRVSPQFFLSRDGSIFASSQREGLYLLLTFFPENSCLSRDRCNYPRD
ncbi:MAG: hypothetical protein AB4290_22135 [Spirulina sp.]